jgi:NAD(P)-dependent dehydrogenase (short-subunit alcohol dehydrogenase family)
MAAKKTQSNSNARSRLQVSKAGGGALRLLGKVAVVTGGSRGIGYAIARTLAAAGCNVVITGRNHSALAERASSISKSLPKDAAIEIVPEVCDVRSPEAVGSLFAAVKRRFRKLDVLVNNAGIAQPLVPIEQTSVELWREVVDTNLTGLFLSTRAALPLMSTGSIVVNNLSVAAKTIFPDFAAYNASKHGALGFTLSLREELMSRGIRVVALMTGAIDTDLWQQFWPEAPRERMIDVESVAQAVLYATLLPPNANLSELVLAPTAGRL